MLRICAVRGLWLALFLMPLALKQGSALQVAHWEHMLPRGAHAVELDTVLLRDRTRKFRYGRLDAGRLGDRPVRLVIWRPAVRGGRSPLRYGDYAELIGFEARERVDSAPAAAASGRGELVDYLASLGADRAKAVATLNLPMLARYGAIRAPGRYPLVVLAVGKDDSPVMHAAAGEYLASRGFVVVGAPGLGADERAMRWAAEDLEAQARDLGFVLAWARAQPGIDAGRVGIVAFSYGSGPALVAARRDSSIAAVVSLDGSIGFADRVPVQRTLPDLAVGAVAIPVLHLNVAGIPRNDLSLLRQVATDLTVVGFAGAGHLDFTTLATVAASVPGLTIARLGDDTWASTAKVHAAAMMLVHGHLEAHLPKRAR